VCPAFSNCCGPTLEELVRAHDRLSGARGMGLDKVLHPTRGDLPPYPRAHPPPAQVKGKSRTRVFDSNTKRISTSCTRLNKQKTIKEGVEGLYGWYGLNRDTYRHRFDWYIFS
jgi:hypothetical protein